ncbi:S-DNA-T family DNA segregation ATPase FtsK/SpoIIIE [Fontibacillus phaseoli]|uniref:S-DNA-T family DNA segregation ATPase FtsK/SpoIIIE n=1 Tax=Fontibacillus phaseoli TaxID=1416533 RepID=A0A369ATJ4_9BACL|nr:DNA translocase FtsK [Fontibacillus phaseoli]RCX12690.1 S-DNA-T family DNA segregation ATPase FtsK/SpoIIIE [Fontibacillus phaseoli]
MARKRKKKKAALGNLLKYEIYGIILITLSIIALSGEAAVGRTLSKMSALILGKFYFVIPLIGIYVGLAVMIGRKWPAKWSTKRSGVLLAVLAFVLMSSISAMGQRLTPSVPLTFGNIMGQIQRDLQGALFHPASGDSGFSLLQLNISGGYIGGFEFALLYSLFGMAGAKLIMIVMLAISFMLVTGLSYVDLIRLMRGKMGGFGELLGKKIRMLRPVPVTNKVKSASKPVILEPEEEEETEEELSHPPGGGARKQKPVFFQLFGFKGQAQDSKPPVQEVPEGVHDHPESHEINWNELEYRGLADHDVRDGAAHQAQGMENRSLGDTGPIIRDFFDQIQREGHPGDDEPEPEEAQELHPAWNGEAEEAANGTVSLNEEEVSSLPSDAEGPQDLTEPGVPGAPNGAADDAGADGPSAPIAPAPPKPAPKPYKLPSFRLLAKPSSGGKSGDQADYMQTARKLEATLESFGVRARVLEVVRGPAVTRYEIQPDIGVKVSRIVNLTDDIALALAAKDIRMEAPIPGKSAIGIEVPNNEVSLVTMREVMETPTFVDAESKLSIAFGRDISGQTIVGNLAKMPHLLVAGATGSGKSVCINGIITSILYKAKPDEVKFMMVDPKMVELNVYNGIPHLLTPVVTDPRRASLALKKIVVEMEKRYELFSKSGARNIEGYNLMMKENPAAVLPYIVVIVDELADLMMVAANDVEDAIARLAQMARAAGIHLIIATQRPSVDVITGVIKANIPSRIAFGVSSQVDSRTILDMAGAEKLLGRGDMLFMPMGASKPVRVQGAFMSDQEVEAIVTYVRGQGQAEYDESLVPEIEEESAEQDEVLDELYDQAVQIVLEAKQASVSLLQRRMRVGYTRAARLIDSMEARGIVGPYEGSKPREVLMSIDQYKVGKISS